MESCFADSFQACAVGCRAEDPWLLVLLMKICGQAGNNLTVVTTPSKCPRRPAIENQLRMVGRRYQSRFQLRYIESFEVCHPRKMYRDPAACQHKALSRFRL